MGERIYRIRGDLGVFLHIYLSPDTGGGLSFGFLRIF